MLCFLIFHRYKVKKVKRLQVKVHSRPRVELNNLKAIKSKLTLMLDHLLEEENLSQKIHLKAQGT